MKRAWVRESTTSGTVATIGALIITLGIVGLFAGTVGLLLFAAFIGPLVVWMLGISFLALMVGIIVVSVSKSLDKTPRDPGGGPSA